MVRPTRIAVALTALALAGCGGTNIRLNPDVGAGGGYPEAADEICAEVADRFAEAQAETPRSFEQAVELLTVLGDLARQGEDALAEIEPPTEDEDAYRRYLQARADVVAELERGLTAAESEDGQAFADARDAVRKGAEERERLARAAGLRACAAAERG
jgi:hypothetical protein